MAATVLASNSINAHNSRHDLGRFIGVPTVERKSLYLAIILYSLSMLANQTAFSQEQCAGGKFTIKNKDCDSVLHVFICYGNDGSRGHAKDTIPAGSSQTYDVPAGSSYATKCGSMAVEKCPATWCVNNVR